MKKLKRIGGNFMYVVTETYPDGHVVTTYKEAFITKLFSWVNKKFGKNKKTQKVELAYNYMKQEAQKTWSPAYISKFDEWFSNCSDYQIGCMCVWAEGKMGPFN